MTETTSATQQLANENGAWLEVAEALSERLGPGRIEAGSLSSMIAANSAAALAAYFGTPPVTQTGARGGTVVKVWWWGLQVQLSHEDFETVVNAADTLNALVSAVGGNIPSPAQPWIKLLAPFIAGANERLRRLDRGNGVFINMCWLAPGVFIPTSA